MGVLHRLVVVGFVAGGALAWSTSAVAQGTSNRWVARGLSQALAEVAERTTPAVVHVEVERGLRLAAELQEVFRDYGLPEARLGEADTEISTGSGVIVSPTGRVITNHHVIEGARTVTVVLADQRRVPAKIVGSDPRTDVAVLQILVEGVYDSVRVGNSDKVRVGELVMAVGSPYDFQSSVTAGIVSAKGRRGLPTHEIQDYIQVDAAVNPGNSGGPLFNVEGEVIGINTLIFAAEDQNTGISFAIPSNMVMRVAGDLERGGRVAQSRVGLLTRAVPEVDGDPTRVGVEVEWVLPESPAERAGLRRGDVVVAVDGEPITSTGSLRQLVLSRGVGSRLVFAVMRDDQRAELGVETASWSDVGTGPDEIPGEIVTWAGMTLAAPSGELRGHFGLPEPGGLVVVRVEPGSDAARMGITAGDQLLDVGAWKVTSPSTLAASLEVARERRASPERSLDPERVGVRLRRGTSEFYSILPFP